MKKKKKNIFKKRIASKFIQTKPSSIKFQKVEPLVGFVTETVQKGESFNVLTKASLISDDPFFYKTVEHLSDMYLGAKNILADRVHQFLVLIHEDLSADLYVNNIDAQILICAKRNLKQGEVVHKSDIADIEKLKFNNIKIDKTDKIIYCFKVGWKFGLFFDLDRSSPLDIERVQLEIGSLYRYLSFQHVYKTLEAESQFEKMSFDGWFPFIEILGVEFKELREAYIDNKHTEERIKKCIEKFNEKRLNRMVEKWWAKDVFNEKQKILQAGINSFFKNTDEGFIACIKIIFPEIEGIIRTHFFQKTGKGNNVKIPDLLQHLFEAGNLKANNEHSLFFPQQFLKYLKDVFFPQFNLETGNIDLSRHTSCHGLAKVEDYTKAKALQSLLILDQIYFYTN